jgi:hypothetical protein
MPNLSEGGGGPDVRKLPLPPSLRPSFARLKRGLAVGAPEAVKAGHPRHRQSAPHDHVGERLPARIADVFGLREVVEPARARGPLEPRKAIGVHLDRLPLMRARIASPHSPLEAGPKDGIPAVGDRFVRAWA